MIGLILQNVLNKKFSRNERKVIFIASLGCFIEFYDFTIFGFYSIYFAPQIYPSDEKLTSMLFAYFVFAIGFLFKILGIILSERLNYKIPAKKMLITTILIMGIATFCSGFLPTYNTIGIYSGLLMVLLRILQGLASGGEIHSMIRHINESMPKRKIHFTISGVLLGAEFGGLTAIMLNQLLNLTLHHTSIILWGWKIPFIMGGIFSFLCYFFRFRFYKTSRLPNSVNNTNIKVLSLFKYYRLQMLVLASVIGITSTLWVNCIIYMPIILHFELNLSYQVASNILFHATIYSITISYLVGRLAKYLNPLYLLIISLFIGIPAILMSYHFLYLRMFIYLGVAILVTLHGVFTRLTPLVFVNKLFPAHLRLAGVYLSVNLSYTLFGVFSPLIIMSLIYLTHLYFITQAIYTVLVCIISIIGLSFFTKAKEQT